MLFILNKCYGGFKISQSAAEILSLDDPYDFDCNDPLMVDALAALINEFGSKECSGPYSKLQVVTIPDDCTDWEINEYDGIETITYVVDGKLYHV